MFTNRVEYEHCCSREQARRNAEAEKRSRPQHEARENKHAHVDVLLQQRLDDIRNEVSLSFRQGEDWKSTNRPLRGQPDRNQLEGELEAMRQHMADQRTSFKEEITEAT